MIRTWLAREERFHGWYINLEQPWTRTTIGFDSCDHFLDVTVSDDLDQCLLKDDDELEFAREVGLLTLGQARAIRTAADSAVDDVKRSRWPFEEPAWQELRPPSHEEPLVLPVGWNES